MWMFLSCQQSDFLVQQEAELCFSIHTKAKYIAAESSYTQLLWTKQMLKEYNVEQDFMTLFSDNINAINILKNSIQHSRTNQIDIHHHFIQDLMEDKVVNPKQIETDKQLNDTH